jgi:hypothetical protein
MDKPLAWNFLPKLKKNLTTTARRRQKIWEFTIFDPIWNTFPAITEWLFNLFKCQSNLTITARRRRKIWELTIFDPIWSTFPAIREWLNHFKSEWNVTITARRRRKICDLWSNLEHFSSNQRRAEPFMSIKLINYLTARRRRKFLEFTICDPIWSTFAGIRNEPS